jgi:alkylhydroperoxidase family enzyme
MRLEPIDRAPTLLGRILSYGMRRMLGRTITPARVLYNRVPRLWNVAWAFLRLESSVSIPSSLWLLIQTRIAMVNGCAFCEDIARARAVRDAVGLERFDALQNWTESGVFSEAERAALAYAEAMNERRVDDSVFATLRKHWDERAIVEISTACALENYYNLINLALEVPDDGLERLAREAQAA